MGKAMIAYDQTFFVFDVESIGLHGQAFAVAGGVYTTSGDTLREFTFAIPRDKANGMPEDREWVDAHVPEIAPTHKKRRSMCDAFWDEWMMAKRLAPKVQMAVECGWPVEARFLNECIDQCWMKRKWEGPYPLHEIATIMLSAGMDPMGTYERRANELPAHEPLADARLSARLLSDAIKKLNA